MLLTTEVRWFYPGAAPSARSEWFVNELEPGDGLCHSWIPRKDYYLRIPQCDHVGAKLRDGSNLEVKVRQASLGQIAIADRVRGNVEGWWKVTMPPPELDPEDRYGNSDSSLWSVVEKARLQRKYRVNDGAIEATGVEDMIPRGAAVELTAIQIEGDRWWTFGLEAFGREAELTVTLNAVADHVMRSYSGCELHVVQSFGYPAWLARCQIA